MLIVIFGIIYSRCLWQRRSECGLSVTGQLGRREKTFATVSGSWVSPHRAETVESVATEDDTLF